MHYCHRRFGLVDLGRVFSMTTPYKQAWDRMSQAQSWRDGLTIQEQETILRALMIADAVETSYSYGPGHGAWGEGHNDCIETLKGIGAGE